MARHNLRVIDPRRAPPKERPSKHKPLLDLPSDPDPLRTTRVYMFHMDTTEFYKIGISKNVRSRIAAVQNGSPITINLFWASDRYLPVSDARTVESNAHFQYQASRSTAPIQREWFAFSSGEARQVMSRLVAEVHAKSIAVDQRVQHQALAATVQTLNPLPEGYDIVRRYILQQGDSPNDYHTSTVSRFAKQYCEAHNLPVVTIQLMPERETHKPRFVNAYPIAALDSAMCEVLDRRCKRER